MTWSEFGDTKDSDINDLFDTNNIHGEKRVKLVSLWTRHPKREAQAQGSKYIVPHSKFCIICIFVLIIMNIWFY